MCRVPWQPVPTTATLILWLGGGFDDFFRFYDESGLFMFATYNNQDPQWHNRKRPKGRYRGVCCVPANFFNEGNISVWAAVATLPDRLHALEIDAITFHMYDPGRGGTRADYSGEWSGGVIRPLLDWTTDFAPE